LAASVNNFNWLFTRPFLLFTNLLLPKIYPMLIKQKGIDGLLASMHEGQYAFL